MTRKEWLRSQRRRKYGKFWGLVIAGRLVLGLGITALFVFLILRFVMPGEKPVKESVSANTPILAEESTTADVETLSRNEAVAESVSENAVQESPARTEELFSFPAWKEEHETVRGIYVSGPMAGSEGMADLIEMVDRTELNTMVIDIKNDSGELSFKLPEDQMPAQISACVRYIPDIEGMMSELKEHGIYTIARIVCFKDPVLALARPDLALCDEEGEVIIDDNGLAWVNPCREEVWDYLIEIALYCADLGFDEVQFDYVRFPLGSLMESADYGVELTAENKHEYISAFLEKAAEELHKKDVPVTADLFGTVIANPTDVAKVGQDYGELASVVDVLCPMVYPSHYGNGVFGLKVPDAQPYETVLAAMQLSVSELEDIEEEQRAVVRPWLQDFSASWVDGSISYGMNEVRAQINAVYAAGYREWILWNARNDYSFDYFRD